MTKFQHIHETVIIIIIYFVHLSPTSNHPHPLQRLVVDEDDNRKFKLDRFDEGHHTVTRQLKV